jgi:hypothetical protein
MNDGSKGFATGRYFLLECYGPLDRTRQAIDTVPVGFAWNRGRRFDKTVPVPLEVLMDGDGEMMPMFDRGVLLWRDDLVAAIRSSGANNFDAYEAVLVDPIANRRHANYKAINILGLVRAADMQKSQFWSPSGGTAVDVMFDELALDESKARDLLLFRMAESRNGIVVHERVKRAVEAADIPDIDFVEPNAWGG